MPKGRRAKKGPANRKRRRFEASVRHYTLMAEWDYFDTLSPAGRRAYSLFNGGPLQHWSGI